MRPNTALGMLLCGAALALLSREKVSSPVGWAATALALAVLGLGGLTLSEYFFGRDLGVDQWLFREAVETMGTSHPGRMSPATSFCFVLMGGALVMAARPRALRWRLPTIGALGIALQAIGGLTLVGYVMEELLDYRGWNTTGVAAHTAGGFVLLGSGLLALARSEGGLRWKLDTLTTCGFVLGILLLLAAEGISSYYTERLKEDVAWSTHEQERLKKLEEITTDVAKLESSQRGYIVAGDEGLVKSREQDRSEVHQDLADLRKLAAGNLQQPHRLDELEALLAQYLDYWDQTMAARRQEGFPPLPPLVAADRGIVLLDKIRQWIKEMETDEATLLEERQSQIRALSTKSFLLLPVGTLLSLTILSLGLFFLNRGVGERIEAEAAATQLAAIVKSSIDAIIGKDLQGVVTSWNAGAERLFGYPAGEMVGQPIAQLIPPTRRSEEDEIMSRVRRGENVPPFDTERLRKDGGTIAVSITVSAIKDAAGKVVGASKVARDITARKAAEEALGQTQAELQMILDTVPAIIFFKDRQHRHVRVNAAGARAHGRPAGDFVGKTDAELGVPHAEQYDRDEEEIAATGQPKLNIIEPLVTPVGARWLQTDKVPLRDAAGTITGFLGFSVDITERKAAEERIREQAALLDHAQDAILVQDLEGCLRYWNKGAERVFGWTAEEAVGGKVQSLLYKTPEPYQTALEAVLSQGEWAGEVSKLTKAGGEVLIEGRWTLLRDEAGHPKSILAINTDISEKKALEAKFLRAQRMESIGSLAGGIAHDLNNVLAPIVMGVELLKRNVTDPRDADLLDLMETSGRRGADMVKQVLLFARGVEGRRTLISPAQLVNELHRMAHDTFPKSITVEIDAPEETWKTPGDHTQLHQVLMNLCVNARDAMPNGGRLRISARNRLIDEQVAAMTRDAHAGPYVILEVADTGEGMPREVVAKIFDPFFTTKEIGKGTGLGLSTTQAIVKSHGGFITVESEPGKGTTFQVNLPAETGAAEVERATAVQELPRGSGELILLIDDEAAVRSITGQTLEAFGYRVMSADHGAEGIKIYGQHPNEIAAVITDMEMPVLDGVATIRVLQRMNPKVKIIAASGSSARGVEAEAAREGVQHFLAKPYTAETMLRTLHKLLQPDA